MVRAALLMTGGLLLFCAGAMAQGVPESDSRYTFKQTGDSYLRLDGRTGHVSICARSEVGWACQMVPDERSALEAEIARLQGENVALKKEMMAQNLPLPGTVKPEQTKPETPRLQLPSDADLDKVVNFVEKVWRRLVEVIAGVQKDILNKP